MATDGPEANRAASTPTENLSEPAELSTMIADMKHGPRGALFLAVISVSLLLLSWLAFYFLLFMPRGPIG